MNIFKKTLALLLTAVTSVSLVFSLSGCSSDNEEIDLIYPFTGEINSYDPQVASTADEYLIIENCFEGLVRCDDDGTIRPGCASYWTVSDDGLTYTFNIYHGLKWCIYNSVKEKFGEDWDPEITAEDFIFALQRAVDQNTNCPLYSTVSCIKNAPEIHSGKLSSSKLGVKSIDEYTLEIQLSYADESFLETLSTAVAMPCNKEFFESTNGRYGLELQYIMFNGQFIITNELDSSYTLKNNSSYKGPSSAPASDLTLNIIDADTDTSSKLASGYYDAAYVRGYESSSISSSKDITFYPYSNITWVMIINAASSNEILSEEDARHALMLSISDIELDDYKYLTKATGFIPPSCTLNGQSYTENSTSVYIQPDAEQAVDLWKSAVKDSGIYSTSLNILVPEGLIDASKRLIQGIQSSIGAVSNVDSNNVNFSLTLESMTESQLKSSISSGDWDIAVYPLEAVSSDTFLFLQNILDNDIASFDTFEFSEALSSAHSDGAENVYEECCNCEKALLGSYCYSPLFYETNYYAEAKGVSGVQFHAGTGRVSFVSATRS